MGAFLLVLVAVFALKFASGLDCFADYSETSSPTCCGQVGGVIYSNSQDAVHMCTKDLPICLSYVYSVRWGICSPAPSTLNPTSIPTGVPTGI